MARYQIGGKRIYLGLFKTSEEAYAVYINFKKRLIKDLTEETGYERQPK